MDEGDGDAGGVEAGEVEPDQEVAARVHLDGADLWVEGSSQFRSGR